MTEMKATGYFRRSQTIIPKGNEVGEVITIDNPAVAEFPKYARRLLSEVCRLNQMPAEVPKGFLAQMLENERVLLLKPLNEENADAFDVRRSGNQVWTNLYEILAHYNMLVPKGMRQQAPVQVRPQSDLGPCLAILFEQAKTEPVDSRSEVAATQEPGES